MQKLAHVLFGLPVRQALLRQFLEQGSHLRHMLCAFMTERCFQLIDFGLLAAAQRLQILDAPTQRALRFVHEFTMNLYR
jgi:hypothetical protein